jgi:hypothetical protein
MADFVKTLPLPDADAVLESDDDDDKPRLSFKFDDSDEEDVDDGDSDGDSGAAAGDTDDNDTDVDDGSDDGDDDDDGGDGEDGDSDIAADGEGADSDDDDDADDDDGSDAEGDVKPPAAVSGAASSKRAAAAVSGNGGTKAGSVVNVKDGGKAKGKGAADVLVTAEEDAVRAAAPAEGATIPRFKPGTTERVPLFSELHLSRPLLKALTVMKFSVPTTIQVPGSCCLLTLSTTLSLLVHPPSVRWPDVVDDGCRCARACVVRVSCVVSGRRSRSRWRVTTSAAAP